MTSVNIRIKMDYRFSEVNNVFFLMKQSVFLKGVNYQPTRTILVTNLTKVYRKQEIVYFNYLYNMKCNCLVLIERETLRQKKSLKLR